MNLYPGCVDQIIANQRTALTALQESGLRQLLGFIQDDAELVDPRWAAYMLATVKWECAGHWQPIEEFGKGAGRPYGEPVTVTDNDGTTLTNVYYGRGYVQLTWKGNYALLSSRLGLGNLLLMHPEHALEPQTAYRIISYGMRNGTFTGRGLGHYINEAGCDYVNARRIINGMDNAEKIAAFASAMERMLTTPAEGFSGASVQGTSAGVTA